MQRIGIYGGTFNPPHLGHIRGAQYALKKLGLDLLLLIPDRIAPHKELPEDSPTPGQRLAMVQLSAEAAGNDRLLVSDMELQREGPSYTYETVEQLRRSDPDAELVLLMGTDMFLSFLSWREPERILQNAEIGVFYRGEKGERVSVARQKEKLEAMGARVTLIDNPVTEISSTDLRRMLIFRCAEPFLPAGVEQYIRDRGLYGTGCDLHQLPMEALEQAVISLLKPSRVKHVLGCRDTAAELAVRWGADVTDAARAGLLHDITKALDGPLQLTLCRQYGIILDDFYNQNPKTLHALTGSLVAQRIFGECPAVVSAIRSHTTGKADMNTLEKIIYVADYMEPNRDFAGVETLRRLAFTDLDAALELGLEMTLDMLRQQGKEISKESREALDWLREGRSVSNPRL